MKVDDLIRVYDIEIDEDEFYLNYGDNKNYNSFREWLDDEIINVIEKFKKQSSSDINEFIRSIHQD